MSKAENAYFGIAIIGLFYLMNSLLYNGDNFEQEKNLRFKPPNITRKIVVEEKSEEKKVEHYLNLALNMVKKSVPHSKNYCERLSIETYMAFQELVENSGEKGLENIVRIAEGRHESGVGHAWIEIMTKKGSLHYETTLGKIIKYDDCSRYWSFQLKDGKQVNRELEKLNCLCDFRGKVYDLATGQGIITGFH